MNEFIRKTVNDDFIWNAVTAALPSNRKTQTDFITFHCPLCNDRKWRGGVKKNHDGLGYYCFNCDFRASYVIGGPLFPKMREFMRALGISERDVKIMVIKAAQIEQITAAVEGTDLLPIFKPNFKTVDLPPQSERIITLAQAGCEDPKFLAAAQYALSRGDALFERADFFWSADPEWSDRVIFPFYWKSKLVGYSGRAIGTAGTKYKSEVPSDFLFNNRYLDDRERQYIIVVEGVPDAIAIDGVSPLGAKMSANQLMWLKGSGKKIILVPDRDKTGDRMIDVALDNNWSVAFPRLKSNGWWDYDCKDAADAVKRHGRLYTLRSIIETATDNKLEINVKRKWM